MSKCLALLVFSLYGCLLFSQDERFGIIGKHSIEANYQFGRIIPHNSRFKAPVNGFTHALEVNYYQQLLGAKDWQRKLHYPEVGASFYFAHNADQQLFGNAYALLATVKFWIVRSRFVDFYVRAATGISFTPTYFNVVDNPRNNVIGSLINSIDQARLGVDFKPSSQLHMTLGVTFTHYSNGGAQQPNLGVNVPALTVGVRYFPKVDKKFSYNREKWGKPKKRHEVGIRLAFAMHEKVPFNGPKYPVYVGYVQYAYYTSVANKVIGGFMTEFDQANYDNFYFQGNHTKHSLNLSALLMGIYVGDEVMMGNVGLMFLAGAYVFNPGKTTPVFVKLGVNYYLPAMGKDKTARFFIGSSLKTHFFVAQYGEIATGVVF